MTAKESCDALVAGIAVTKDSAQAPAGYDSRFTVGGRIDAKANVSLPKDKCSTLHQHVSAGVI